MQHGLHLQNVRAAGGTLADLTGRKALSSRERIRRESGVTVDEALALAAYRRYCFERRSGKDAATHCYDRDQTSTKPARRSSNFDARIVRKIDFERCLTAIGNHAASILKLYYVDGESMQVLSASTERSTGALIADLAAARRALVDALDAADLI